MSFTLGDIRQVVRNVTGSPNASQLPDAIIDDYINKYYQYVLPDDMKPFSLLVDYRFNTLKDQVQYVFDLETYVSLEPGLFVNGNQLLYYQNKTLWLRDFQYQYNQEFIANGDGVTSAFAGIVGSGDIVPGTVIFADDVEQFQDDGLGVLTGSAGGSGNIVYSSGAFNILFNAPPALDATITATYAPIVRGTPRALYYNGHGAIQLSPIPDQSYLIEGQAYIMPTAFIAGGLSSQVPSIQQWGYVIGYGTALEIFRQRGQLEQVQMYQPAYDKYLDLALSRSTQQFSNQRTSPKW
jgi:hypothetical protein